MASVSYLSAAGANLILAILVLLRWRNRPASLFIFLAAVVSASWAGYSAWQVSHYVDLQQLFVIGIGGVLSNAGWFAALLALIAHYQGGWGKFGGSLQRWGAAVMAFVVLLLVAWLWPVIELPPGWCILGTLLMTVIGLVLVEQLYRHTPVLERWAIKWLCLGLGGIFAFDLFLLADQILLHSLQTPTWQARGVVTALVAPLIAVSIARQAPRDRAPTLSRQLVFHTTALSGAGAYLLLVGVAGYLLRETGGDWGVLLQVALLFGALLLLALVLFSGSFRARLNLWISKHFFNYKYDYRAEWLRLTATLSAADAELPFRQRAIYAIAELVDSPSGMLWVRDGQGDFRLEETLNFGEPDPPREPADGPLASFLVASGWIINIDEWRREPKRYSGLLLPEWLSASPRCWLLVPLLQGQAQGEELVGFVVLGQPRALRAIEWEDRDLLKAASRQLAVYVALVQTSEALLEARQFETFHRLAAFLVHDLKNVSGQLGLVLGNATRHRDNPEFIDSAFHTMTLARARRDRTRARLGNAQPEQVGRVQRVDLGDAVREAVARCKDKQPEPQVSISATPQVIAERERLVTVLAHLLRNAQEAIAGAGEVQIRLYQCERWAYIEVADNGHGMDERFIRERLFRPFQTTKGNAGMGVGVYEVREYIGQLGGRVDVSSTPGEGTTFTIRLVARDDA